jgi:hypothetical protein
MFFLLTAKIEGNSLWSYGPFANMYAKPLYKQDNSWS